MGGSDGFLSHLNRPHGRCMIPSVMKYLHRLNLYFIFRRYTRHRFGFRKGQALMSEKTLLVDRLISEIREGKYKPNDKLPSENELADLYKVPRMVIRKVYERLQELGYIFSKQGKGSYVQNQKLQIPLILTGDVSFTEKMKELKYDSRTMNLSCEKIAYDSSIYHSLQVNR